MAVLFFSREGLDSRRSNQGHELTINTITRFFHNHEYRYTKDPPLINIQHEPSPYSAYTNVVVKISENEINERFKEPGFYWFPHLEPDDCEELSRLPEYG